MTRSSPPAASTLVPARHFAFATGAFKATERAVPIEAPIEILVNSMPLAVMMATPADLDDFAIGFAFTEGVIAARDDVRDTVIEARDGAWRISLTLRPDRFHHHLARQRAMAGRSGCGVCGLRDLESLPDAGATRVAGHAVSFAAVARGLAALQANQPLNDVTRAVHAAAFCTADGNLVESREDVGRHNALDKLIGALLHCNVRDDNGFVLITSRCSFEMVEKAAAAGVSTLVAISAPTSLAIERAKRYGVSLLAIARDDSVQVFTGAGL